MLAIIRQAGRQSRQPRRLGTERQGGRQSNSPLFFSTFFHSSALVEKDIPEGTRSLIKSVSSSECVGRCVHAELELGAQSGGWRRSVAGGREGWEEDYLLPSFIAAWYVCCARACRGIWGQPSTTGCLHPSLTTQNTGRRFFSALWQMATRFPL